MTDRKETQTNLLLQFFRGLQRCKGETKANETGAEGAKREVLDLELGLWTGLSNEVWQVSVRIHSWRYPSGHPIRETDCLLRYMNTQSIISLPNLSSLKLLNPALPLPNALRPVEIGTSGSGPGSGSGGRYTPFFVKPLVWPEDDTGREEQNGSGRKDAPGETHETRDRAMGKGLKRLELDNLSQVGVSHGRGWELSFLELFTSRLFASPDKEPGQPP